MAETYKAPSAALTDTLADIYTCPTATSALAHIQAANIGASGTVITIKRYDASTATAYTACLDAALPYGVAASPLTNPIMLEAGDKIQASCATGGSVHLLLSVIEVS